MVLGCFLTFIMEKVGVTDLGFIFNAANVGGFTMAIYVPLILYMNLKYLPKSVKPGVTAITMMCIASAVYIGFAISSIIWEITTRL